MSEAPKELKFQVGMIVNARSARLDKKVTEPPDRFTEATLLEEMKFAHKYAKNEQDREMLKEVGGLGTSRTRTPMIQGLVAKGLFLTQKVGKKHVLISSLFLRKLIGIMPPVMCDPALTAKWEFVLSLIEKGQTTLDEVLEKERQFVSYVVELAKRDASLHAGAFAGMMPASTPAKKGAVRKKSG
jgi:DNA topoisomerase-3